MSLSSIGLKLERAVVDCNTDTHAYIATNVSEQIEGEEDSIIVISFRGTASVSNMKTDLNFRQVGTIYRRAQSILTNRNRNPFSCFSIA